MIKNLTIIKKYSSTILRFGGAAYDIHLNKLFTQQKHIRRAALVKQRLYPSKLIFKDLNVPTTRQIFVKKM